MDLTNREKGIWISLTTQLLVFLLYFVELHRGVVTLIVLLYCILVMIVLQVVLQTILAILNRPQLKDERDIAIERIAYRNAYTVLVAAIIACLTALIVFVHLPSLRHIHLNLFQAMNYLIFFLLLAEIAKLASQLVLYRRAA